MITVEEARARLATIKEPNLGSDLVTAGIVEDIRVSAAEIEVRLAFPYPAASVFGAVTAAVRQALAADGVTVNSSMRLNILPRTVQGGVERLPGVKNIIAVASAKGGVGKSTTAVNLALALAAEGAVVGVLDADIYGPSLPLMLGVLRQKPAAGADGGIAPVAACGLQVMSIGFLVDDDQPMVWRGPMATRALGQLLRDTRWDGVDYLILDMPPGTGDIQLSIAQQIPVTGAVIVTTPQELAVADARRGLVMFGKVSIPVLGVVENMSVYRCPHCGNEAHLFGAGGGEELSVRYDVECLGALPLQTAIREAADGGAPTVFSAPDSDAAACYRRIAVRAAVKIAEKTRDRSAAFPKIVVSS